MKKEEKRTYKINTARVANVRLAEAKTNPENQRGQSLENAREIILKLIDAIKRL